MTQSPRSAFERVQDDIEKVEGAAVLVALLGLLCLAVAIFCGWWPAAAVALFDAVVICGEVRRLDRLQQLVEQCDAHGVQAQTRRDHTAREAGQIAIYLGQAGLWRRPGGRTGA